MKKPPEWRPGDLEAEVSIASENFRTERLKEPLTVWKSTFDSYERKFGDFLAAFTNPANVTQEQLSELLQKKSGELLRYMAGPPISDDDLKILAGISISAKMVASDEAAAKRLLSIIVQSIDPRRFPWIAENRLPTESEKHAAVIASAALITAQKVATRRRNESKTAQEDRVKSKLRLAGYQEAAPRRIQTLADAPDKGEFCRESLVGSRKADVSVRLRDGRLMPIECKVSNSALNSVKRINNDAAIKANVWRAEFGKNQIIPAAVLSGVFNVANLLQAQEQGLTLFWAHKLQDLIDYIDDCI